MRGRLGMIAGCSAVAVAAVAAVAASAAVSRESSDRLVAVAGALDQPVGVVSAPGAAGSLYVVERPGKIVIVRREKIVGTFLDLTSVVKSNASDEQGLLSLAFSPAYRSNHRFYVDYTDQAGDTRVVEYRSRAGIGDPATARLLLHVAHPDYANHNGGDLQFDKSGLLYLGTGDGGSEGDPHDNSQNLDSLLGKLLRVNPLAQKPHWKIVGYGLRNPWRYSFDSKTGDLWIGDVGQNRWEEIDYRPRSQLGNLANYGWSVYEGDTLYKPSEPLGTAGSLVKPLYVYGHQNGACAIIGGYVYRGGAIASDDGRYYFGDDCNGHVWTLTRTDGHTQVLVEPFTVPLLSAFGQDAEGNLYAASLTGTVYAITR